MGANYKNWIPKGMIAGLATGTVVLAAGTAATLILGSKYGMNTTAKYVIAGIAGVGALGCLKATQWSISAYKAFSYNGKRKLSKQIIDGTAEYVTLPEGGLGLDVGCGSGALTIACAKKNPHGRMIGIDRWGREYKSFNKQLCEDNALEEGVDNVEFRQGDACKLDFPDEYFDAVTSNYVYHNITGKNKQELLKETLRTLKKGGTFAIHDIMSKGRYGDMQKFVNELYDEGYEKVRLIDTTDGKFMTKWESRKMMLAGSSLLVGVK
jgi:ubiquinone/menaquinone biosynthesis C-methylase UbiE